MALVKPIARTKAAFDARQDEIFYFNVEGGDLVTRNKITIVDQDTNEVVYTYTTPNNYFIYNQTVPQDTLTNGGYYYYYFNTFNSIGEMSVDSNSVPFRCYSKPVIEITNVPELPQYITTSNYIFNIVYSQAEGELLDFLIATIYDSNGEIYYQSDKILSNPENIYQFSVVGMTNGNYSIGVVGVTVNSTKFNSSVYNFAVHSITPEIYARFSATNDCNKGYIEIQSSLTNIEGETNYEPRFVKNNTRLYLLPRQSYCKWSSGYKINTDFTMGLWGQIGECHNHDGSVTGHSLYEPVYTHDNTRIALFPPQNYVQWDGIDIQKTFAIGIWGSIGEEGEIFKVWNNDNCAITLYLKREVPYGETDIKDCFELYVTDTDGNEMGYGRSNYIPILNPNEDYYIFLNKTENSWSLFFSRTSTQSFDYNWNEETEAQYGQMIPFSFNESTDYPISDGKSIYFNDINDYFPMTHCRIKNGNYEHLHITSHYNILPTELTKVTDRFSILNCPFSGSLNGTMGYQSEIFRLWNENNYRIIGYMICEIPYGSISRPMNCIEVKVYDGDVLVGYGQSNYVEQLQPNDDYVFMIQKRGTTWTLALVNKTHNSFELVWEDQNPMYYGQTITGLHWNNSPVYGNGIRYNNTFSKVTSNLFPLTNVRINNGIYDQIDVSYNVSRTINDYIEPLEWDFDTVINCTFNGDINAGNIEGIIEDLGYVRLKRRDKGTNKWITLKQVNGDIEDISFTYYDALVPHGVTQEYALVPVSPSGTEGNYLITEVTPHWRFNFITIGNKTFPIYADVRYGTVINNRKFGLLEPIQSKYPIVVRNSILGYLSGTITAKFLGDDFLDTRKIDNLKIAKEIQEFQKYMDLGYPICLKDYNGWVLLCRPTSGDSATFNGNYGNGIADIAFNWVQQGNYDSQDDLYNLGFIDINI